MGHFVFLFCACSLYNVMNCVNIYLDEQSELDVDIAKIFFDYWYR